MIIELKDQHDFVGRHRPYSLRAAIAAALQNHPAGTIHIEAATDVSGKKISARVIAASAYAVSNGRLRIVTKNDGIIASWK